MSDYESTWSSSSSKESTVESVSDGSKEDVVRPSKKVVLLTGGAGFIGSHTGIALLERGDRVIVIDEMNDYYDVAIKKENLRLLEETAARCSNASDDEFGGEDNYVFYEGNICDKDLLRTIFEAHAPTHVCHLAARAGVRPSIDDPSIYVQSNVMGTVTLLELAAQHGVANFVYASSSSVYGGSTKEKFSEEDIVDEPVSQYAATKKSCELFAATYNSLYNLNCTGLRFFTVYGPRGRPDMAPFKFVDRIMNGRTIDQYGDGTSERDYTYISDIVDGVLLSLDKPLGNVVLNLGRGSPCRLSDFISTIEQLCGKRADINVMPMQPGDVYRTSADTTRAETLLGYRAKVSLQRGLEQTVNWYQQFYVDARNEEKEV